MDGKEGDRTGGKVGELDWSNHDKDDALSLLVASPPQISTLARPRQQGRDERRLGRRYGRSSYGGGYGGMSGGYAAWTVATAARAAWMMPT